MANPPTEHATRTRSQSTLDGFFTRIDLAASPLKQARIALKHPAPTPPSDSDKDSTTPPHLDNVLKRPSSPAKDAALVGIPDLKRLRHDALFPSSRAHDSPDRRAKSVPPAAANAPIPLLDLNNVPPSPRRSPAKFRIASVPPESPKKRAESSDADVHLSTFPRSVPSPPFPTLPVLSFDHTTPLPHTNPTTGLAPFMTPMSPLTPLPIDRSLHADSTLDLDATPVPKPNSVSVPVAGPSNPPAPTQAPKPAPRESMLPRPKSAGVKARMKPRDKLLVDDAPPAKKVKNPRNKKPSTLGPPQIRNPRNTRSQRAKSLAASEDKGDGQAEDEIQDAFADILSSPRPSPRLPNTQSTPAQRPEPRLSLLSHPKTPRALPSQIPHPFQMPHSYRDITQPLRDEPSSPPAHRRRSCSMSYAQPTSSSAAKASPAKPSLPPRASSRPPSASTPHSTAGAPQEGGRAKPAGPFDFKSLPDPAPKTPAPREVARPVNGSKGGRAQTPVAGVDPKGEGKERAKSVGPALFTRAQIPARGPASVERATDGFAVGDEVGSQVEEAELDDADVPTPTQGRTHGRIDPDRHDTTVLDDPRRLGSALCGHLVKSGFELAAGGAPTEDVNNQIAAQPVSTIDAEADAVVDGDEATTMFPLEPPGQLSEESELSELSELDDSSVAEQRSASDEQRPEHTERHAGLSVPRRPPLSQPTPLNSSLSTLNQALERLNAPAPSRPNTSLGFHRSLSSDGDSSLSSAPGSSDDPAGGKSAKPKSTVAERPRPSTSMSMNALPTTGAKGKGKVAATLNPVAGGQAAVVNGQTKLRQTTLMLPPPIPAAGTRTTRLRSAAAARAAVSGPSTPRASTSTAVNGGTLNAAPGEGKTPRELERMRQATLALAPSSGKVCAGLAAATPSQASSGVLSSTATPGSSSSGIARPAAAATGATTKRTFLAARSGSRALGSLPKPVFGVGRPGGASVGVRGGFGLGPFRGRGGGGRVVQRASKVSSLPVVVGSPVKGSGTGGDTALVDEGEERIVSEVQEGMEGVEELTTKDKIDDWLKHADKDVLRDLGHGSDGDDEDAGPAAKSLGALEFGELGSGPADPEARAREKEEREKEREARRNASRRASMASHLLTQSLSALPSATSPTLLQGEDPKGKGRAVSSSYPSTSSAAAEHPRGEGEGEKDAVPTPPPRRAHATRLATGALSTPPNAYKEPSLRSAAAGGSGLGDTEHASGGTADGKSKDKAKAETGAGSPAVLSVLKDCRIFVDVRSEEGDDAGSLFVDMLRNMGAKIAARVGSRCTHVVFKNGLMSTLKGYRMLSDPKPHVVGIGWVVACAEQRRRVEETQFPVNLNLANVAGVNKRRKSVIPKTYSPMANKIATSPASSDSSRIDNVLNTSLGAASRSLEVSSPTAVDDGGESILQVLPIPVGAGVVNEESLPPLEMARRRRSMMPS